MFPDPTALRTPPRSCPHCDTLANLPDRTALLTALDNAAAEGLTALFLIDFDALNRFNDVFGLDTDDRLLHALVENIRTLIGGEALLAWTGGARLAVVLEGLQTRHAAEALAEKLQHLFSEPLIIGANLFYVTGTIGIALLPLDAPDAYTLLKLAESTVRRIQRGGRNLYGFARSVSDGLYAEQIRLMQDLPAAIENGEIYFVYQCQYERTGRRCSGAEMLARWRHPLLGDVPPSRFIPLAEQSGMIGPMTVKAMIDASKTFERLASAGRGDIALSLNISPVFLMEREFAETVRFMHENYGLSGRRLNFEMTEELMMLYPERLDAVFGMLGEMGIGIEIDDFGTGYASLKYLTDLPAETLKIDRSFVCGIDGDAGKQALFKAIVDMAGALGIGVIAEGIENAAEHAYLQRFEGIRVQGFYYGEPMEAEGFAGQFAPPGV